MGLETVLQEILAQAAQEEQSILSKAQQERDRLVAHAEGQADELRSRKLTETRARREALRREILSASEFQVRRKLLMARRELAEDFRRRLLQAIADLSKAENEALLSDLVKRAKKTLPQGVVHARAADLPLLVKAGYDKGGEWKGAGGFRVESPDGTVVLDLRYETLLDDTWKDVLTQAQKLFEG